MTPGDAFLEQFFGTGNEIAWTQLQSPAKREWKQTLAPFLDLYVAARQDANGIAVLPRRFADDELRWYVLSRNPASARHAWDVVNAYLGASYSDISERAVLSDVDPIDQLVQNEFGRHCFSVRVTGRPAEKETIRERLRLMANTLRAHPRVGAAPRQTVGRLLRSFELALENRDETAGAASIDQLRSSGHLDAINMAFLEIRLDGALRRWGSLLARPDLVSIIDLGVPRKVTELLLEAVFEEELARFEVGAQGVGAVEHFRSSVEPRYRPLYRTRAGLDGYYVDAQFLLIAALRGHPRDTHIDALLARYDEKSLRRCFLESIAGLLTAPMPVSVGIGAPSLASAQQAFSAGDIDSAFASASQAAASPERATWMLRWALEMDVPEALAAALAAYEMLPAPARDIFSLVPTNKRLLTLVGGRLGLSAPTAPPSAVAQESPRHLVTDWSSWMHRLTLAEEWPGAVAAANQGEGVWRLDLLEASADAIGEIKRALLSPLPTWGAEALRDALPCLVRAWLGQGASVAMKPLYTALCQVLLADESRSMSSATALVRVATALVEFGRTPAEYAALVSQTAEYLLGLGSPGTMSIGLEALESLVDLPCPNTEARTNFASVVETLHLTRLTRVNAIQLMLLHQLLEEAGVAATTAAAEAPLDPAWATLSESHVAFYSLSGQALERVRTLLVSRCKNISTFENTTGGALALRQAARSADVFVIAWGCTKHSTMGYITDFRPSARPTLIAAGRGSSALLAAIDGWLGKSTAPRSGVSASSEHKNAQLEGDAPQPGDEDERTIAPAVLAEFGMLRNRLEPKLRKFIKRILKSTLGPKWIKPIVDALPEKSREQLLGVDADKILNERLLLSELITVLHVGWDKYFKVLEAGAPADAVKKASVQVLLDFVNAHREDAHAKLASEGDKVALQLAVHALEAAIDRHLQD